MIYSWFIIYPMLIVDLGYYLGTYSYGVVILVCVKEY